MFAAPWLLFKTKRRSAIHLLLLYLDHLRVEKECPFLDMELFVGRDDEAEHTLSANT